MEEQAQRVFHRADVEGKGFLVKKDMQRFQHEVSLSADQLNAVFESLDTCATGFLTLDQFLAGVSNLGNGSIMGKIETHEAYNADYHNNNEQIIKNIVNLSMLSKSGATLQKLNAVIQDSVGEVGEPFRHFIQDLGIDMQRLKEQVEELERVLAARDRRHEVEIQKLFEELENQLSEEKEKMSAEMDNREKNSRLELREKLDAKDRHIAETLAQRDEVLERLSALQEEENNMKLQNTNLQKLQEEHIEELNQQRDVLMRLQETLEETRNELENKSKTKFQEGFLLAQKLSLTKEEGLLQQLKIIKQMQSTLQDGCHDRKSSKLLADT